MHYADMYLQSLLGRAQHWPHGSWHSTINDVMQFLADFQEMFLEFQTISLQSNRIILEVAHNI